MNKSIDGVEVLATNEVCKYLGFVVSREFLDKVGVVPIQAFVRANYYKRSDLPKIRKAIIKHLESL